VNHQEIPLYATVAHDGKVTVYLSQPPKSSAGRTPNGGLCAGIHKFGHAADFAGVVDAGKDTGCFGDDFAGGRAGEFVSVLNLTCGNVSAGGFESKLLIIKGGSSILDMQLGDDEENACGLEVLVGKAVCP